MTRLYLIFFLSLAVSMTKAQDFCGVIRYTHTYYKGKSMYDITARVNDVKTEDFYICGNKIKIYFDGKLKEIFITDSLTYFMVRPDSVIGYIKADSAYGERLPEYGKITNGIIFKGKIYKSIEENSNNQFTTYYFNDDIKINPELFSAIELYHWNKYFAVTNGSLRLVSINKRRRLISISEATEVKRLNLEGIDFQLPAGYKIESWNYFRVFN